MKRYRSFMSDYDCLQIALTVKLKTVVPGHFKVLFDLYSTQQCNSSYFVT